MSAAEGDLLGRIPTELLIGGEWFPGIRTRSGCGVGARNGRSAVDGHRALSSPTALGAGPPDAAVLREKLPGPVPLITTPTSEPRAIELANSVLDQVGTRDVRRCER